MQYKAVIVEEVDASKWGRMATANLALIAEIENELK